MSRCPRSTTPSGRPPAGRSAGPGGEAAGATAVAQPMGQSTITAPCLSRTPKPQCPKSTIPRRGPPPREPKKVDYKRPAMTKSMAQRLKHSQKLQEDMERKERERVQAAAARRPRRTAAPMGGDARMGREKSRADDTSRTRRPASARSGTGGPCPSGGGSAPSGAGTSAMPHPSANSTRHEAPSASQCPAGAGGAAAGDQSQVTARTRNLAKSMNADIVQAEPLQSGPVENVIIPPGTINSHNTTIVSIPQPEHSTLMGGAAGASSSMAHHHHTTHGNRSVQIISETLDEQDAAETAIVNSKLQDLQLARRDFVMAVANVGGNAISLTDEDNNLTPIADISPPPMMSPGSPCPGLQRCPSLDDPFLVPEYGRNHPTVDAARDFMRRLKEPRPPECPPIMQDMGPPAYLDYEGEDDEEGDACFPYTQIPRRNEPYRYDPMEVDRLEMFFDTDQYPPRPEPPRQGPPPGRECLNPDLWDLQDDWYYKPPSEPDLIDFDRSYC